MIRFTKDEKRVLLFILFILSVGIIVSHRKNIDPRHHSLEWPEERAVVQKTIVNINEATKDELISIKGIGPVLAGRIVSYRETHGPFIKKEDIKKVKGIGDKTFEEICDGIRVK